MIKKKIKQLLVNLINLITSKIKVFPDQFKKVYNIEFQGVKIFFIPKNDVTYRRWKVFERNGKEKNTIDWIETFEKNSIFFDIGANIGVFSIYAALKKKVEVYAFEPEPNSFIDLFNAIQVNKANVIPMLVPLTDQANCNFFNLSKNFEAASSGHKFGNKDNKKLSYAVCADSIDNLILNKKIPQPNYIKIDVDGLEEKVISGLDTVIKGNTLKSILIEFMYEEQKNFYKDYLKKNGYFLKDGPSGNNRNYIFLKEK